MEVIDDILDNLWLIHRQTLLKYKELFNKMCKLYHKPNPIELSASKSRLESYHIKRTGETFDECFKKHKVYKNCPSTLEEAKSCKLYNKMKKKFTAYIERSLGRIDKAFKVMKWQWFEVIDFMYERPELVNPNLVDEYIEGRINEVCSESNKNNPLSDGHRKRFGKFWFGPDGKWNPERRIRFQGV
jgi:hypothetical protein